MQQRTLTLGHSPDPDDAFMFYALAKDLIPTQGFRFEHILQDIQTLNERATRGELDITAISIHAYAYVCDQYALLPSGASMGDGYGPMLVAKNRSWPELPTWLALTSYHSTLWLLKASRSALDSTWLFIWPFRLLSVRIRLRGVRPEPATELDAARVGDDRHLEHSRADDELATCGQVRFGEIEVGRSAGQQAAIGHDATVTAGAAAKAQL